MRGGDLRHQLLVETRAATKDAMGGQATTWATVATVWCSIHQLSGRALEAAQMVHSASTHEIFMRYAAGITAAQRGTYQGRHFDFLNVENVDERGFELRVLASEGQTSG